MSKVVVIREPLRWFTLLLCALLVVVSILELVALHTAPFRGGRLHYDADDHVGFVSDNAAFTVCVLSVFLIVAAVAIASVELDSTAALTLFSGLISPLGRGLLFVVIGLLVFGFVNVVGLVVGGLWMIDGIIHMVVGYRSFVVYYESGSVDSSSSSSSSNSRTTVTTTTTTTTKKSAPEKSAAGGGKNFCKQCGATLVANAAFCSECRAKV